MYTNRERRKCRTCPTVLYVELFSESAKKPVSALKILKLIENLERTTFEASSLTLLFDATKYFTKFNKIFEFL